MKKQWTWFYRLLALMIVVAASLTGILFYIYYQTRNLYALPLMQSALLPWGIAASCALLGLLLGLFIYFKYNFTNELNRLSADKPIDLHNYKGMMLDVAQRLSSSENAKNQSIENMNTLNAYISHEINNSLNILLAMVQLQASYDSMQQFIKQMAASMEDILILSRLPKKQEMTQTDILLICAELVAEYSKVSPDIEFSFPDSGISPVMGHGNLYRRAIANLLGNAIKHGKGKILFTLQEEQHNVILNIRDQGEGIDMQTLDTLFEPNNHLFKLKKDSHGIGLGLVKTVADLHGAAIWAENAVEGGASFYFVMRAAS